MNILSTVKMGDCYGSMCYDTCQSLNMRKALICTPNYFLSNKNFHIFGSKNKTYQNLKK